MFKEAVKGTIILINNHMVQPTNGIVKLAEKSELTETVRDMFADLFSDAHLEVNTRQKQIENFVDKANELLEKYEPGKWKYKQDFRSVLFY